MSICLQRAGRVCARPGDLPPYTRQTVRTAQRGGGGGASILVTLQNIKKYI